MDETGLIGGCYDEPLSELTLPCEIICNTWYQRHIQRKSSSNGDRSIFVPVFWYACGVFLALVPTIHQVAVGRID